MSDFIIDTKVKIKKDTVIATASDFHIDKTVNKERMKKLLNSFININSEYILVLGDLIDNTKMDDCTLEYIYNLLVCLAGIAPIYCIYGNPDFMAKINSTNDEGWFEYNSFYLLNNKTVTLTENIDISGIHCLIHIMKLIEKVQKHIKI